MKFGNNLQIVMLSLKLESRNRENQSDKEIFFSHSILFWISFETEHSSKTNSNFILKEIALTEIALNSRNVWECNRQLKGNHERSYSPLSLRNRVYNILEQRISKVLYRIKYLHIEVVSKEACKVHTHRALLPLIINSFLKLIKARERLWVITHRNKSVVNLSLALWKLNTSEHCYVIK